MPITFQTKILESKDKLSKLLLNKKYLWKANKNYANYFTKAISLKNKDKLCKLLLDKHFGNQRKTMPFFSSNKYLWKAKTKYANYFPNSITLLVKKPSNFHNSAFLYLFLLITQNDVLIRR